MRGVRKRKQGIHQQQALSEAVKHRLQIHRMQADTEELSGADGDEQRIRNCQDKHERGLPEGAAQGLRTAFKRDGKRRLADKGERQVHRLHRRHGKG